MNKKLILTGICCSVLILAGCKTKLSPPDAELFNNIAEQNGFSVMDNTDGYNETFGDYYDLVLLATVDDDSLGFEMYDMTDDSAAKSLYDNNLADLVENKNDGAVKSTSIDISGRQRNTSNGSSGFFALERINDVMFYVYSDSANIDSAKSILEALEGNAG